MPRSPHRRQVSGLLDSLILPPSWCCCRFGCVHQGHGFLPPRFGKTMSQGDSSTDADCCSTCSNRSNRERCLKRPTWCSGFWLTSEETRGCAAPPSAWVDAALGAGRAPSWNWLRAMLGAEPESTSSGRPPVAPKPSGQLVACVPTKKSARHRRRRPRLFKMAILTASIQQRANENLFIRVL